VARVYSLKATAYGCSVSGSKSYRLENATVSLKGDGQRMLIVGPVAVAGEVAAYGLVRAGTDFGDARVVVRRLTDGMLLRSSFAITGPLNAVETVEQVDSVVAKRDGAVAWIATEMSLANNRTDIEVHKADKQGETSLDSGQGIRAVSLGLHRSTVTWKHGQATRSTTLR